MKRFSILLPLINLSMFAVVGGMFVAAHGGWAGDTDPYDGGNYAQPMEGVLFFNRWTLDEQDSWLPKGYILINAPAFGLARLVLHTLGGFWDEFKAAYPLGLSYASYSLMLAVPFSVLQWLAIGLILDRFRRRVR